MSRSNYSDDLDNWELIRWRGAVQSAINGRRGQKLLREILVALEAMPDKRLITDALEMDGEVCALGAVCRARRINTEGLDPEDAEGVAGVLNIAPALGHDTF